ncbi:MAG: HD domain-containing protein [Thermaerobacterales bacterium]
MEPTRDAAWQILTEYTASDSLIKHALAVEAGMRHYARKFGAGEERWALTGLLHDFDYDRWSSLEDHPFRGAEILQEKEFPEDIIEAILGHASHTGVPRETLMARALFAVDELTGLITAVALVRPSRSILDVKVSSVKKKLKDKAFARGVNRAEVRQGAEELEVPLDEHIGNVIEAMREAAPALELDGRLAAGQD